MKYRIVKITLEDNFGGTMPVVEWVISSLYLTKRIALKNKRLLARKAKENEIFVITKNLNSFGLIDD